MAHVYTRILMAIINSFLSLPSPTIIYSISNFVMAKRKLIISIKNPYNTKYEMLLTQKSIVYTRVNHKIGSNQNSIFGMTIL